jgi:AcrR family transcriptional regulator
MTPKIITGKKARELQEGKRGRGRPAVFDRAVALTKAMKLFWERGYEGTSFDELIAAMGISASSFYNSFGSKEALYCEATRTYLDSSSQWFFGILNDPSIDTKTAFARLFEATAEEFTRGDHPPGCMISLAGTHCPPGKQNIRDMMAEHRASSEGAMANRMRKGVTNGDLPEDTDCDMLAAYYGAVARGLAVQARDGASREKLAQIGRLAMSAWPAKE